VSDIQVVILRVPGEQGAALLSTRYGKWNTEATGHLDDVPAMLGNLEPECDVADVEEVVVYNPDALAGLGWDWETLARAWARKKNPRSTPPPGERGVLLCVPGESGRALLYERFGFWTVKVAGERDDVARRLARDGYALSDFDEVVVDDPAALDGPGWQHWETLGKAWAERENGGRKLDLLDLVDRLLGWRMVQAARIVQRSPWTDPIWDEVRLAYSQYHRAPPVGLDDRETAAVLAGLRLLQSDSIPGGTPLYDVLTGGGRLEPLDAGEIEALCERINATGAEV